MILTHYELSDCDEDDEDNGSNHNTSNSGSSSIVNALKRSSTSTERQDPDEGDSAPKIRAETNSTLLKQFINNID